MTQDRLKLTLKFKDFLKQNHAWLEFLSFIESDEMLGALTRYGFVQNLNQYFVKTPVQNWLSDAFLFANHNDQDEVDRWARINLEWNRIAKNL